MQNNQDAAMTPNFIDKLSMQIEKKSKKYGQFSLLTPSPVYQSST